MKKFFISAIAITVIFTISFSSGTVNYNAPCLSQKNTVHRQVYLGGFPFGVKLYTDGVMVTELTKVETESGSVTPAMDSGIRTKDIITDINGVHVTDNEQLSELIRQSEGNLELTIRRDDEIFRLTVTPVYDISGVKRTGMWIKDSAAGMGTVTYIDPATDCLAGLGHGICDSSTQGLLPLESGKICKACVTSVKKSTNGSAGCLEGYFEDEVIGNLVLNDDCGIYADSITDFNTDMPIEIAASEEITTGAAQIYTTISADGPQYFDIEIVSVNRNSELKTQNMVIRITDENLISQTGGIVQGMSGSPIIQNDRLVGAVTHVFLNSPTKGYAIFAENMTTNFDDYCRIIRDCAA